MRTSPDSGILPRCPQKQAQKVRLFRKWCKALVDSGQGLVNGRRSAAEIELVCKQREAEHALLARPEPASHTLYSKPYTRRRSGFQMS